MKMPLLALVAHARLLLEEVKFLTNKWLILLDLRERILMTVVWTVVMADEGESSV
jgi:hypothetical protein